MKYLKYFENKTSAEGYKTESWFVGYLDEEDLVLYSGGGEVIKDGEMVMDEPDPTAGFVDLGLSVMWASCNVGADNPEDVGSKLTWSSNAGYDSFPNENLRPIINPRTPTYDQIQELLANTTQEDITINGIEGRKFSATNGNSIFIPFKLMWTKNVYIGNAANTLYATTWDGKTVYDNSNLKTEQLPHRCICDYPPIVNTQLIIGNKIDNVTECFLVMDSVINSEANIQFVTNTDKPVTVHASYDYSLLGDDSTEVTKSHIDNGVSTCYMSLKELQTVADYIYVNSTNQTYHKIVYFRFVCEDNISVTPLIWNASECIAESTLILPNKVFKLEYRQFNTIYRMRYEDFVGYPFKINWTGSGSLKVYISDTCNYVLSSTNKHVLKYTMIRSGKTSTVDSDTLSSWEPRADNGYFYVRFDPSNQGIVTFTTDKPADI